MSMHTNEPWRVGTMAMSKRDFASLHSRELVTVQSGADVLAIVWSPDDDDQEGESGAKALANLMAASPLLYETLKQQLVMLGMIVNAVDAGESVNPTIEAATVLIGDALRAARGER